MPKIFISYRREETAGYAGRLRDRLVQHFGADQVFMDVDTIELGVDFSEVIEQAVADVDVFLCVMGPDWATLADEQGRPRLDNPNDFVRMEVTSAIERDIRVIPVLVRNAVVPPPDQLPSALEALSRRNALQLTDTRFHADVDRLVAGIRKLDEAQAVDTATETTETPLDVDIPAAAPTALEQPTPAVGAQRRSGWNGGIALLLIVLLGGGAGFGWHLYTQEQRRVAQNEAEVAKLEASRELDLQAERAALEEAKREVELAAERAAQREAEQAEFERAEARRRAEAELQAQREAQALERQRAELRAEEELRVRAREQAELEARRQAEQAAAIEAHRREAERAEADEARRREAQVEQERAEARRVAELEARAQARREAEAAERRRNEALKVRSKRMVEDIARLYGSHKTADNCGVVRRIATTLERYFDTHYPLPDDARVSVRYPRRIDDPKVSDLAKDRNLRIRGAKSECF